MIYFIQNSQTCEIKIGYTGKDDPKVRLSELQTGSSALLYLLATREGTKQTENDLHRQFKDLLHRPGGEWFRPGPELIKYICACDAQRIAKEAVASAVTALMARPFPETQGEIDRRKAREKRINDLIACNQAFDVINAWRVRGLNLIIRKDNLSPKEDSVYASNAYSGTQSGGKCWGSEDFRLEYRFRPWLVWLLQGGSPSTLENQMSDDEIEEAGVDCKENACEENEDDRDDYPEQYCEDGKEYDS